MIEATELYLPRNVVRLLEQVGEADRHPGLQLDKLTPPCEMEIQKQRLTGALAAGGGAEAASHLTAARTRWAKSLPDSAAVVFDAATMGPLAIHLSRASGLENAGLCLHPVYGFAYLPGSGLKGLTRAWAETVAGAARHEIRAVFGWAAGVEEPDGTKPKDSHAGAVIFHDAWPKSWPDLRVEITNNHHPSYYRDGNAPGDWDSPNPVFFPAIAPETVFSFALEAARDCPPETLELARNWLQAALCHAGAGAKTAAGFGRFRLIGTAQPPTPPKDRVVTFTTELRLTTPAFLAGAHQKEADCDLHPGTLRGLLRWWWRTLHVAHVPLPELQRLETLVWGDITTGSAVRICLAPTVRIGPAPFDKQDASFFKEHDLQRPPRKTTQGLFYAAYGMDENSQGSRRQRWRIDPGAGWQLTITAPSPAIARQAAAALWLLCRFGGIGSKSRKGFGSLADISIQIGDADGIRSLEDCRKAAAAFRSIHDANTAQIKPETAAIDDLIGPREIALPWRDPWFALDQVGYAAQGFAQRYKHESVKQVLGLPRKIHGPREDGPIKNKEGIAQQDQWSPPIWLGTDHPKRLKTCSPDRFREASPVHYHLSKATNGTLVLRVVAFPSSTLGGKDCGRTLLAELLDHLTSEIGRRTSDPRLSKLGQSAPTAPTDATGGASLPNPGTRVRAVLLEERTKKGGWRARDIKSGIDGPIQNSPEVPVTCNAGDEVDLVVRNRTDFGWPTQKDQVPQKTAGPTKKPGPGGRPGGGRR